MHEKLDRVSSRKRQNILSLSNELFTGSSLYAPLQCNTAVCCRQSCDMFYSSWFSFDSASSRCRSSRQFQLIRRRRRRLHLTPFLVSPTDFCRTHKPLGIGSITLERIQCCKYTNYATSLAAASSLRVFRFFLCVYSSARRSSKRFSQISSLHERNRGKWWRTLVKSVHCMRCRSVSGNVYSVYTHTQLISASVILSKFIILINLTRITETDLLNSARRPLLSHTPKQNFHFHVNL